MRIIGIDPGLRKTGWGVIESKGTSYFHLGSGVITTKLGPLSNRLLYIHTELTEIFSKFCPDAAAVEKTFVNTDLANSLVLGHARAMALLVPAQFDMEVGEYSSNTIKTSVVGKGHATKDQVSYMVSLQVNDFQDKGRDSTDALAIALTHSLMLRSNKNHYISQKVMDQ